MLSIVIFLTDVLFGTAAEEGTKWAWAKLTQKSLIDVFTKAFELSFKELQLHYPALKNLELDKNRLKDLIEGNFKTPIQYKDLSEVDVLTKLASQLNDLHIITGDHALGETEILDFIIRILKHAYNLFLIQLDQNDVLARTLNREILREHSQSLAEINSKLDILVSNSEGSQQVNPRISIDNGTIRKAFFEASSLLRHEPHKIYGTDIELKRDETEKILSWIYNAHPSKRVAAVAGKPGYGKTVLARALYMHLYQLNQPVLAIQADRLNTAKNTLNQTLNTDNIVQLARHTAINEPTFIIIDQLDRLASTANSDVDTLHKVIDLISNLRDIPQLYIILVCREFELNHDAILNRLVIDQKFALESLAISEVNRVLETIAQISLESFSPAFQSVLREPVSLATYANLLLDGTVQATEQFLGLYELYSCRWQRDIIFEKEGIPPSLERQDLIFKLIDAMDQRRKYLVPSTILDEYPSSGQYLKQINFIEEKQGQVSFVHQTLYSYCYARTFLKSNTSLADTITSGCQGFFERPKLIQVLEFLRTEDPSEFRSQLDLLLFPNKQLRVHLRKLLIQWLAQQTNPNAIEQSIVKMLLEDVKDRQVFLRSAYDNPIWLSLLKEFIAQSLAGNDEKLANQVLRFLYSHTKQNVADVIDFLTPYLEKDSWKPQIGDYAWRIRDWSQPRTIEFAKRLLEQGAIHERAIQILVKALGDANLEVGCEFLRIYLFQQLEVYRSKTKNDEKLTDQWKLVGDFTKATIDEYHIREFAQDAVEKIPEVFIDKTLLWFIEAELETIIENNPKYFPYSSLFRFDANNSEINDRGGPDLDFCLLIAFKKLAEINPVQAHNLINELSDIHLRFTQNLVAKFYLHYVEAYPNDIYAFLLGDKRRLELSDISELIGAVFLHLNNNQRLGIEQLIRNLKPTQPTRQDYIYAQQDMFRLAYHIELRLLSPEMYRFVMMLRRYFPQYVNSSKLRGGFSQTFVAPVPIERLRHLSQKNYLRVLSRYDDSTDWESHRHFGGGITEQSRVIREHAIEDPQKLYEIALQFDTKISDQYLSAIISGLAEAENVQVQWIQQLLSQRKDFAVSVRGNVCQIIAKRPKEFGNEMFLNLLHDWVKNDDDPEKETEDSIQNEILKRTDDHHDGWINIGINSRRGTALEALFACAFQLTPAKSDFVWLVLTEVTRDPSLSVQALALNGLAWWQSETLNTDFAVKLFTQYIDQNPILLTAHYAQNLLDWLCKVQVETARLYLEKMLEMDHEWTREVAAQIICVNSFQQVGLQKMADQVVSSTDVNMRRGAAHIYARNLEVSFVSIKCQEKLLILMDDEDEEVRNRVGSAFYYLKKEHLHSLKDFIERFTASPAAKTNPNGLIKYLTEMRLYRNEYPNVLQILLLLLENIGDEISESWDRSRLYYGDELLRFLRSVYDTQPKLCRIIMNIFDLLVEHDNDNALSLLRDEDKEWR